MSGDVGAPWPRRFSLCGPGTSSLVLTVQVPRRLLEEVCAWPWRFQMVLLSSGLGTADLSQRPEPRSPFGESRRPHHWALRGTTQGRPGILYEAAALPAAPHGRVRVLAQCTVALQDLKLHGGRRRGPEFGVWSPSGMHLGDPHPPCGQPQLSPPKLLCLCPLWPGLGTRALFQGWCGAPAGVSELCHHRPRAWQPWRETPTLG